MKKLTLAFFLFITGIISLQAQETKSNLISSDGEEIIEITHYYGDFHLDKSHAKSAEQYNIDPGVYPEGDYMANSCFTPDGQRIILANKISNIVTVFDWNTMDVLSNIEVGEYPSCVRANDDYFIVGCQFSDSVYIISLADYSISAVLPAGEQPCWIEMSPDGETAWVACDIDDVCMAFDMGTQSYIGQIQGFPIYLNTFSYAVQVSRGWEKYNGFVILPAGDRIAIAGSDDNVAIYSTSSFDLITTISILSPRAVAISGDGNYIACAANPESICHVHQINAADYTIENSVEISGYNLGTQAIVANQDGSKAYIGTNNNTSTLVRFNSQDFISFSSTYTAFWLGVSHDHLYAVSGQNRFSIINFETEEIEDQYTGLNQSFGAVSPVDYHVCAYDPLRYEGVYFFDFTTPDNIDYRGTTLSGEDPEGDTPGAVAISNDRSRVVAAGNLSYNVPVIDLGNMSPLTSVPVEESCYDVKITADGLWAVAGGYNNNTVKIIDLTNNTLEKTIQTGQRPMIVEMAPDGQRAYIGNIKQNTLSVIDLDGGNSSLVTSVPCGVIGVYTPFFGIRSAVRVSPDGEYVLVTASFDDELQVFDTQSNQIVASLPTGDFPIDVAIDNETKTACVVNTFDASYDIISLDGANSSVTYHKSLNADYPMDVAYNSVEDMFYICSASSEKIFKIDPAGGEVVETIHPGGAPFHIEFYSGIPLIQMQGDANNDHKIMYGETEYNLPYAAAPFSLNEYAGMAGIPMPGPDMISIIELGPPPFIKEGDLAEPFACFPNPATDKIFFSNYRAIQKVEILELSGKKALENKACPDNGLDISALRPGAYILRITGKGVMISSKLIVQ